MGNNYEVAIESLPLSVDVTRDVMTIEACTYRIKGGPKGWSLEFVNHQGVSTVWHDFLDTDQEAFDEFVATVERKVIGIFLATPTKG